MKLGQSDIAGIEAGARKAEEALLVLGKLQNLCLPD